MANRKMKPTMFRLPKQQINWLKQQSEKTGLNVVEIVRRALDAYAEAEEAKEQRRLFTPQQRQDIREIAQRKGVGEVEVVRSAVNKEMRFYKQLYKKRQGDKN